MKILYLSCHAILEYDEVSLFTELGHEVFSASGAYQDPTLPTRMRPEIKNAKRYDQLIPSAFQGTRENLHQELIDWADVIVVMHIIDWIVPNWEKMKRKIVVWRSIGQSSVGTEMRLEGFREGGLKIVRYSPLEWDIQSYVGEDALIRFYKDPAEWSGWNGDESASSPSGSPSKRRRGRTPADPTSSRRRPPAFRDWSTAPRTRTAGTCGAAVSPTRN